MPKNSLQKEMLAFLEDQSNRLIEDLEDLKTYLKNETEKIVRRNRRCRPLSVSFYKTVGENWGLSLSGTDWSVSFYIYKVKE
ncbi:hypothetical protein N4241_10745 [Riemerella anatipestifer]|uniref:hypothetical protein n=1 Tax=Riemerella anatipestifer TaxID=34085 RepID=UPI0021D5FEBD|nr:hypothetical protein [Riemerella anatipestifer]MCU7571583.1 hypothetical protein [Riemerella anatipestifer]